MKRISSNRSKDLELSHEIETQTINAIARATGIPANMCKNSLEKSIIQTGASLEHERNALLERLPSDIARILKRNN